MITNLALLVICLLINAQAFLVQQFNLTHLSYLDEILCLGAYIICPLLAKRKQDYWVYLVLAAPFISIIHGTIINYAAFSAVRLSETVLQSVINFKLLLYFAIFYCLHTKGSMRYGFIFIACLAMSIIGYTLNIITPEYFIFSEEAWQIERNRISGFQFKPNDLAILLGFAFIYSLFRITNPANKIMVGIATLSLIFFTSSRTALILAIVALLMFLLSRKNSKLLIFIVPIAAIALLLGYDRIAGSFFMQETLSNISQLSNINHTQYIRAIMVYYGFHLAIYFPTGVGAGNFGSVMSQGSPAYEMLGVSGSYFFQNMIGIYDSNLAAILGEYGFIGLAAISYVTKKALDQVLANEKPIKITILTSIAVLSVTQPIFAYHVNSINILLLVFSLASPANINRRRVHPQ